LVAGHEKRHLRARREAQAVLASIGEEIRRARLEHDLSQTVAGASIGMSASAWSRLERGAAPGLSLVDLARALSVVGLDLQARTVPGGAALRDKAHVALLQRLRRTLGPNVRWRTEVPLPNPGDRRAWDALVTVPRVRVGIEAETRARDSQALQRRLNQKRRDGGVDHLWLVLADTRHNRAFLRSVGQAFLDDFPIPGGTAMARLAAGEDPGGSAIVRL
jgi:transcriptional regulator with XRE-family HTH domain